jgi:hypothetical protein
MTEAHIRILTPGFTTPNGQALLFPLLKFRSDLARIGITISLTSNPKTAAHGCDILIVDSKFYRDDWAARQDSILEDFARFGQTARVVYFDTTDSTGVLQAELFPHISLYLKNQVLRDRSAYMRPLYGQRTYTDFYNSHMGVVDDDPIASNPVGEHELTKLRVGWNSALANYSWAGKYLMAAYRRVPFEGFLQFPRYFIPPANLRKQAVSARFSTNYARRSVAWQRQEISQLLGKVPTGRVGRTAYFDELRASKVVVSPFGWGEIAYRDFEAFLSGALLLKPDMGHLETWPDLFQPGRTILCHDWDLSDFVAVLNDAISDYDQYRAVAEAGQALYRSHLLPETGGTLFGQHLKSLLDAVL